VLDRALLRGDAAATVEAAVRGGADWVQVRERALADAALLALAEAVADAARRGSRGRAAPARVLINRRADLALAVEADGVHLGFDALAPAEAAALLPPGCEIGVSAHTPDEVRLARDAGASYAHLAPIWAPISKPAEREALGPAGLRTACCYGIPVLAQGGVTAERCADAIAAGAAGIAVTGDILLADDPGRAAAMLRAALDSAVSGR
jgi:thiamine-phosphate diphosphorylase